MTDDLDPIYQRLLTELASLPHGERDLIATAANTAALLFDRISAHEQCRVRARHEAGVGAQSLHRYVRQLRSRCHPPQLPLVTAATDPVSVER
jgi:hypothetical protein